MTPNISPVPDQNLYMLVDDYLFQSNHIRVRVPAYFLFDGASIPPIAWQFTYTPYAPKVLSAALIHDWLYLNHQVDRATADQIFYETLIQDGALKAKAWLMYQAVRVFGMVFWPQSKKDISRIKMLHCLARYSPDFDEYHFPEF